MSDQVFYSVITYSYEISLTFVKGFRAAFAIGCKGANFAACHTLSSA